LIIENFKLYSIPKRHWVAQEDCLQFRLQAKWNHNSRFFILK